MLIAPTLLKNSAIHGRGIFAERLIKKGDVIARFNPEIDLIITFAQWEVIANPLKEYLEMYCYLDRSVSEDGYIFSTDASKHINHSEKPNMCARGFEHVALRDIEAGEELTCSYHDFDWDGGYAMPSYVADKPERADTDNALGFDLKLSKAG